MDGTIAHFARWMCGVTADELVAPQVLGDHRSTYKWLHKLVWLDMFWAWIIPATKYQYYDKYMESVA